jgi:hypothetical protein
MARRSRRRAACRRIEAKAKRTRTQVRVITSVSKQSSCAPAGAQKSAEFATNAAHFSLRASRALDCFVASLLAMTVVARFDQFINFDAIPAFTLDQLIGARLNLGVVRRKPPSDGLPGRFA